MEEGNHYLPADVAATAAIENWSQDRINEEMQKYTLPEDSQEPVDPANPGDIVVSQEDLAAAANGGVTQEPQEPQEPVAPTAPTYDFKSLGFESEDDLKSFVGRAKQFEEYASKYKEVENVIPFINDVKNPFANDTIHRLNNFVKVTGISDLGMAAKILDTNNETLNTDPVTALAILEVLNDKDLASLGFDRVKEYVANKHNISVDDKFETADEMPISLQVETQKALKTIENKRKEFDTRDDYFTNLQNQRAESQRAMDERSEAWSGILNTLPEKLKSIPVKVNVEDVGEVTVDFAVSKEDLSRYIPEIQQYMVGLNPDEAGIATAMKVLENRVWLENRESIMKEVLKSAAGKIKQDVTKEVHNGGSVVKRADAPVQTNTQSPHLQATMNALGL